MRRPGTGRTTTQRIGSITLPALADLRLRESPEIAASEVPVVDHVSAAASSSSSSSSLSSASDMDIVSSSGSSPATLAQALSPPPVAPPSPHEEAKEVAGVVVVNPPTTTHDDEEKANDSEEASEEGQPSGAAVGASEEAHEEGEPSGAAVGAFVREEGGEGESSVAPPLSTDLSAETEAADTLSPPLKKQRKVHHVRTAEDAAVASSSSSGDGGGVDVSAALRAAEEAEAAGLRRSRRHRAPVCEFWRHERPIYERRKSGGFMLREISAGDDSALLKKGLRRTATRHKGRPRDASDGGSSPSDDRSEWRTPLQIATSDGHIAQRMTRVVVTPSTEEFQTEESFAYSSCFGNPNFRMGSVKIRSGQQKPRVETGDQMELFFVKRGTLEIEVGDSRHHVHRGAFIRIPAHNVYTLRNVSSSGDAECVYVTMRETTDAAEEEEDGVDREPAAAAGGGRTDETAGDVAK